MHINIYTFIHSIYIHIHMHINVNLHIYTYVYFACLLGLARTFTMRTNTCRKRTKCRIDKLMHRTHTGSAHIYFAFLYTHIHKASFTSCTYVVCLYVCSMYVRMYVAGVYVWMDGWMDACTHIYMVPPTRYLGLRTYIYTHIYAHDVYACTDTYHYTTNTRM